MDVRLDIPVEASGVFRRAQEGSAHIHGRLRYDPEKGIELDLVESPWEMESFGGLTGPPPETIYGRLFDGTVVTLGRCRAAKVSFHIGGPGEVGSPTNVTAIEALFGGEVADIQELPVKDYSTELTSLANWTCASAVHTNPVEAEGKKIGFDVKCRYPDPILVVLPSKEFDLRITLDVQLRSECGVVSVAKKASLTVIGHSSLPLHKANIIAWQSRNLLALLVGSRLNVKAISVTPAAAGESHEETDSLQLLYQRGGRHENNDVHPALMMLPYPAVKNEFPSIVEKWFNRSDQAILATSVFFGSQENFSSPAVNVRFLAMFHAAESYHRSLGTGFYMDQAEYDQAIQEFISHVPAAIQGDHRVSLKSRLRYGNEHSLRKRMADMLNRLPEDVRTKIAANVTSFAQKAVDTRNYYTHYDHASQANAFSPKDSYVAAERLRLLVMANLLRDLGIKDDDLLKVLERSQDFIHWTHQTLPL